MRHPKVVGEILGGVVPGNALVGRLPFAAHFIESAKHQGNILDLVYRLGLLLLRQGWPLLTPMASSELGASAPEVPSEA